MMLRNFFVLIVLGSLCSFSYGIWSLFMDIEDNRCSMTYMFDYPQFSRVKFKGNEQFSDYGLYYYYEGRLLKDVNTLNLNGAPVIFIPGNGGSYKQVRSLASVALNKAFTNNNQIHLDYFTIDYNEELSALYGGYLDNQKRFLKICIKTVLRLYKDAQRSDRKVVLIGHSMGGKLAQAILNDSEMVHYINSNIFISAPLDKPVINLDSAINEFYEDTTAFLYRNRALHITNKETNYCGTSQSAIPASEMIGHNSSTEVDALANVLLISIGGGNRDVLVRAGLTTSAFSDIHAMTSSIPNVWLSCDHLASVWCLQLVLVINRFLFSITTINADNYVLFKEDKLTRLQAASSYFVKPRNRAKNTEVKFEMFSETWKPKLRLKHRDRAFMKVFPSGIKKTYNEMISLDKNENFRKLYVEVINMENQEWLYGCTSNGLTKECASGTSLSHHIQNIPSTDVLRSAALLDLLNIKKTYANWTHVVVRLPPIKTPVVLNVDNHAPIARTAHITGPRWFTLKPKMLFNETEYREVYYKIKISSMTEPYQGMQLIIDPRGCADKRNHVTAKICVPWARGFDRYEVLTFVNGAAEKNVVYVNAPISAPRGYNTTTNPIIVELFLAPSCMFIIRHKFSVSTTMSKTVQEFFHWLPAHFVAVLLIVLKDQISHLNSDVSSKFRMPFTVFFQCTSFYIVTGCRIVKLLTIRAKVDITPDSMYGGMIVHSIAIALSIILAFVVWFAVIMQGNLMHKVVLRLARISFVPSTRVVSIVTALPIAFGVLGVSLAYGSCSGLALILACVVYFIVMANSFKDYLENTPETASNTDEAVSEANGDLSDSPAAEDQKLNNLHQTPETQTRIQQQQRLDKFSFHLTMFLMLCLMAGLNFVVTIAWLRNYKSGHSLSDPALVPTIIVLGSLSLMWQLKVPNKVFCHKFIMTVLYVSATCSIIFCLDAVYRINYVVAAVFAAILAQEFFSKIWMLFYKRPVDN